MPTWSKERIHSFKLTSDLLMWAIAHTHEHIHTHGTLLSEVVYPTAIVTEPQCGLRQTAES